MSWLKKNTKSSNSTESLRQDEIKIEDSEKKENQDGLDDNEFTEDVITHTIKGNDQWVTKRNLRYNFAIDVPKNWTTIDSSGNGDGFDVIIESTISAKVFGENNSSELLNIYLGLCKQTEDFVFDSGHTGTVCK